MIANQLSYIEALSKLAGVCLKVAEVAPNSGYHNKAQDLVEAAYIEAMVLKRTGLTDKEKKPHSESSREERTLHLDDDLNFGKKHPGKKVKEVLQVDPSYLRWMDDTLSFITLSDEVKKALPAREATPPSGDSSSEAPWEPSDDLPY